MSEQETGGPAIYTDHEIELLERYAGMSLQARQGSDKERWAAADAVNMVQWLRRVIPRGKPDCFGGFKTGHTICNGYQGDQCRQQRDCKEETDKFAEKRRREK